MTKEEMLSTLYGLYYDEASSIGRADIDASLWAYEQASQDIFYMSWSELKLWIRQKGRKLEITT